MRLRYNGRNSMQQTEFETAQYSMELMRQNVQHLFDKEIENVLRKYIEVSLIINRLKGFFSRNSNEDVKQNFKI